MYRNRAVSLVLVGLFLWQTGCTSYKLISIGDVSDHGRVRVTLTTGERETLHDPRVVADTITGDEGPPSHDTVSYPLDQVVGVEASSTDVLGTVAVVIGVAFVALIVISIAVYMSDDTW